MSFMVSKSLSRGFLRGVMVPGRFWCKAENKTLNCKQNNTTFIFNKQIARTLFCYLCSVIHFPAWSARVVLLKLHHFWMQKKQDINNFLLPIIYRHIATWTKWYLDRLWYAFIPSRGSLVRPSWLMMYRGMSVLIPWPTFAWPSATSSRW